MDTIDLDGMHGVLRRLKFFFRHVMVWKTGFSIFPYDHTPDIASVFPEVTFDFIVCRYFKVLLYVDIYGIAPVYVDIDDSPLVLFDTVVRHQRKLSRFGSFFWRMVLRFELWWHSLHWSGIWLADKNDIGRIGSPRKTVVLNNIPFNIFGDIASGVSDRNILCAIGGAYHQPNKQGVAKFLKEIWPAVHDRYPQLRFLIVGKGWDEVTSAQEEIPNVEYVGFVKDLKDLYSRCLACIVPIDTGAGTCIKTLEALANGRVCFATPFGARGLPGNKEELARNGVMIYENASEFIDLLDGLMSSCLYLNECESAAKFFIENHYSEDAFFSHVSELLPQLKG